MQNKIESGQSVALHVSDWRFFIAHAKKTGKSTKTTERRTKFVLLYSAEAERNVDYRKFSKVQARGSGSV